MTAWIDLKLATEDVLTSVPSCPPICFFQEYDDNMHVHVIMYHDGSTAVGDRWDLSDDHKTVFQFYTQPTESGGQRVITQTESLEHQTIDDIIEKYYGKVDLIERQAFDDYIKNKSQECYIIVSDNTMFFGPSLCSETV